MNLHSLFRPEEVPLARDLLVRWLGLEGERGANPEAAYADLEALLPLAALLPPRHLPLPGDGEVSVGARLLALLLPFWTKEERAEPLARELLAAAATQEVLGEGRILEGLWEEAGRLLADK